MIKKVVAILLILTMVFTLTSCDVSNKFSYWDGMTKSQAMKYVQDTLQEKYGEEFVVNSIGKHSGEHYTELVGSCSPKLNKDICFEIEVNNFTGSRILYDGYIQAVVRQEIKRNVDNVLSQYCDLFATEVDVHGLSDLYDSGILSVKEATVKNYSEALPDTNETSIWIALNDFEIQENLNYIVEEITSNFYLMHAFIHFYYVTDNIIKKCIEETNIYGPTDRLVFYRILNGHYPCDAFAYNGQKNRLVQIESTDK